MDETFIFKYAKLIVYVGANVQKNQVVFISCPIIASKLCQEIVKQCYIKKAKKVIVNYYDQEIDKLNYKYQDITTLNTVKDYDIKRLSAPLLEEGACRIRIFDPQPGIYDEIDKNKIFQTSKINQKLFLPISKLISSYYTQWTIAAWPTYAWAKKIYPKLKPTIALERLWKKILEICLINNNDPIVNWKEHNANLHKYSDKLSKFNFDYLHFKNKLGTDLTIKLVNKHIWKSGSKYSTNGKNIEFNPNIPTFETFTMPHRLGVNGIVYATKPLVHQNVVINNFWFKFKDGKVIAYGAKQGKEVLQKIFDADKNNRYLGEVALVNYNSPISLSNIIFYETLYDENASCHLALGNSYKITIANGTKMSEKELLKNGANQSQSHVDFMFGSSDLSVIGYKNKKGTTIFKNGNFVI